MDIKTVIVLGIVAIALLFVAGYLLDNVGNFLSNIFKPLDKFSPEKNIKTVKETAKKGLEIAKDVVTSEKVKKAADKIKDTSKKIIKKKNIDKGIKKIKKNPFK